MGRRAGRGSYLKQRGAMWWVRVKIPAALQHLYLSANGVPRSHIEQSLGTDSYAEAEQVKLARVAIIMQDFRKRRREAAGTLPGDVREALDYRNALAEADDRTAEILHGLITDRAYAIHAKAGEEKAQNFAAIASNAEGKTLREAWGEWLASSDVKKGTAVKYARAFKEVMQMLGVADGVPTIINDAKAREYVDWLNTKARTPKGTPLDSGTIRDRVSAMSAFWRYLEQTQQVPKRSNPWSGHAYAGARQKKLTQAKERPYTDAELVTLCKGPEREGRYTKQTILALSTLGLYTGCRLEELCARKLGDVEPIKGGYMLHIREGKTPAAIRALPVLHRLPVAVLQSLIGKRKDRAAYLFPDLTPGGPDGKRSWNVQKAMSKYRRTVGIPEGVDFHSTRRSFATRMVDLGVDHRWAERYFGHRGDNLMAGTYAQPVEALRKVALAITYPAKVEAALRTALSV